MDASVYYLMIILFPLAGFLVNLFFTSKKNDRGAYLSTIFTWLGFAATLVSWIIGYPLFKKVVHFGFFAGGFAWLLASLVLFISAVVQTFSYRYFSGNLLFKKIFSQISLLTGSLLLLFASDNIFLFILFWSFSNYLLIHLMMHKKEWRAALQSKLLAGKYFVLGSISLGIGFYLLAEVAGSFSLQEIIQHPIEGLSYVGLTFLLLAALIQSGSWPFHKWLQSSLNAPTPISAFMHAGLVNGGGILLIRLAPLFLTSSLFMKGIVLLGLISLVMGTLWKMIQPDTKRMLASSTIGQMGFMIMQCGLGFFSAATAHILWHALFKSLMFLRLGSVVEKKRYPMQRISTLSFFYSLFSASFGGIAFSMAHGKIFPSFDTSLVLTFFAFIASLQASASIMQYRINLKKFSLAVIFSFMAGLVYGASVTLFHHLLSPEVPAAPQSIGIIHWMAMASTIVIWMVANLQLFQWIEKKVVWKKIYLSLVNSSQPDPATITPNRGEYQY